MLILVTLDQFWDQCKFFKPPQKRGGERKVLGAVPQYKWKYSPHINLKPINGIFSKHNFYRHWTEVYCKYVFQFKAEWYFKTGLHSMSWSMRLTKSKNTDYIFLWYIQSGFSDMFSLSLLFSCMTKELYR